MDFILSLFDTYPTLLGPATLIGWLGWCVFLGFIIRLIWINRKSETTWNKSKWKIFGGLLVLVAFSNLFIGFRLPLGSTLPLPGIPQDIQGSAVMVFSAVPILLAGGILGPVSAALLGMFAGFIRFFWDNQSIFSPLEFALLSLFFSFLVRQRYRSRFFAILREPLLAVLALLLVFVPVYIVDGFLVSSGSMAVRLDFALASFGMRIVSTGIELLIAGLMMQILVKVSPTLWGRFLPLTPSPIERSLESRFLFGTGTLVILLLIALLAGDWLVAGAAAREMLHARLAATAELSSENVPFVLETGQNLASQIAILPELAVGSGEELNNFLKNEINITPFFDELLVFDQNRNLISSYSLDPTVKPRLFPEENSGLDLAFNNVLRQIYTIPPAVQKQDVSARISFLITISDAVSSQPVRVLIARTDLINNPFALPLLTSLQSMSKLGGSGILLDENGRILIHPASSLVMTLYSGQQKNAPAFFDDTAPNGTRNLVYYQPVEGRAWSVVLTVPAQQTQELSLSIAAPLTLMILLLGIIALISLRLGLKTVTTSLHNLAEETVRIAQGQLDHKLTEEGVDEVGQLGRSFEQMRISLQARLDELNRLLLVSQGVASSLDVRKAVQPVMEAILATGASSVRMILPSVDEDSEPGKIISVSLDQSKPAYSHLDEQITLLAEQKETIFASNSDSVLGRRKEARLSYPKSLCAIALKHENHKFGVLWAGYDQKRQFSDLDIRFLTTLAGQAALAASNHNLLQTAETGRQRLAIILSSTPDPVLVIDQNNHLLLANPSASHALGVDMVSAKGKPVENFITQEPLLNILKTSSKEKLSVEVILPDGRVYFASSSLAVAEGRSVGRVCILRDVTHFKELDKMKTDFVNTVSHDLRSPLTLMRGYASMLDMVGSLNQQQQDFVKKMILGVDNMAKLVNTLLDLGRIEAGVGLQLEIIPVVPLIEKVVNQLQLLAIQKKIELTLVTPKASKSLIEVDRELFEQVIYNLVENAIKYTPVNGKVLVRLQITDDDMLFDVKDTGIGIDYKDMPHLFEKFYRGGQRESRSQRGSGLGLAIVKSIVEHHGGRIWVDSEVGIGSTFIVKLPLRQVNINHPR